MSLLRGINPNLRNIRNSELAPLGMRAWQIKDELRQGARKPYKELIDVSSADPHRAGVKPLSFVRQVLAVCYYPQLAKSDKLPADVRQRAQRLLGTCAGGSAGSYCPAGGIPEIIDIVCEFISRRDDGVPSYPENIFITSGAQRAFVEILNILVNTLRSPITGVLTPCPSYPPGNMAVVMLGGAVVPYYLDEEQGWELKIDELHRALESAKGVCDPTVLYVINPGNPTGHVQSRKSIEEVIRFASEKRLFLMVDEVYQDSVFEQESRFVSYKKVLAEMGPPLSHTVEMASFHSVSKGFIGECGLRGGYVELVNVDPSVMRNLYTLMSRDASTTTGQLALDLMINPPQPGDPSYPLYNETQYIRATWVQNVKRVLEVLNSLPGISCQPVKGGGYALPRLHLPPGAIQKAKEVGMLPDYFYCSRLLEETELCVGAGSENGQRESTYHIRYRQSSDVFANRISIKHPHFLIRLSQILVFAKNSNSPM
uniref:alanine transaminase n=1 Tax=Myripristis murdjan TaxID=586833 RepID=A0A667YGT2_9TELE